MYSQPDLRETNDLVEGIGVHRGVEASVVFRPHSRFYLRVYIIGVKNDFGCSPSLKSSYLYRPPQLDLQNPPIVQRSTLNHTTYYLPTQ